MKRMPQQRPVGE